MHSTDRYLAAIWQVSYDEGIARLFRVAAYLHVRPPSASRALDRLQSEGLLEGRKPIRLSRDGLERARNRVIAHQVTECWLQAELEGEWSSLHEDAERIAGVLTPPQVLALWRRLGRPQTCPHGNPIPIPCGDDPDTLPIASGKSEIALADAPVGTWHMVRITEELEADPRALRALKGLGAQPDRDILLAAWLGPVATLRVEPKGEANVPVAWLRGIRVTRDPAPVCL